MWRTAIAVLLLVAGAWQLGGAAWLVTKAQLAQFLIGNAWERQLRTGEAVKPWPWADTRPVAKLVLNGGSPLIVLDGSSGQALAFGPGLLAGAGLPGQARTTVIAAHRDTHFVGLDALHRGDTIGLQDAGGHWYRYRVVASRVADSRRERLPIFAEPGLLLVTCFPFHAINSGGPLRYLVYAEYLGESPPTRL